MLDYWYVYVAKTPTHLTVLSTRCHPLPFSSLSVIVLYVQNHKPSIVRSALYVVETTYKHAPDFKTKKEHYRVICSHDHNVNLTIFIARSWHFARKPPNCVHRASTKLIVSLPMSTRSLQTLTKIKICGVKCTLPSYVSHSSSNSTAVELHQVKWRVFLLLKFSTNKKKL